MRPDAEITLELRELVVTVRCWIQPAEPDVGIMSAYLDDYEVISIADTPLVLTLTEDEENEVMDAVEAKWQGEREDYDYDTF